MTVAGPHGAYGSEGPWSSSWLSSLPLCCAPLTSCTDKWPRRIDEKHPDPVIYDQPPHHPRPVAMPERSSHRNVLEKSPRGSVTSKRKRFWSFSSTSSSRRPHISAPSDFRHIYSASPQFPELPEPTPSRASNLRPAKQLPHRPYRPLELSIYMPSNRVSPILPHFDMQSAIPAPSSKSASDCVSGEPKYRLEEEPRLPEHQKSFSDSPMSFHFPRRQALDSSPSTSQDDDIPPLIPPKARARSRAYTSPDVEKIKERVASAMLEVEKLQKQIDDVIERQSLYSPSRPSTPHSMARTMPDLEPMPSIPALPPAAPSFAERLNSDIDRPHTAPIRSPHAPVTVSLRPPRRAQTPGQPSTPPNPPLRVMRDDLPLSPPLPLVLRPPLRKKKSFSRVSSWLFPGSQHDRNLSLDSVTNAPRPIKGNEGFYQCVSLGETSGRRQSTDSVDTVTTWESDDEDRTVPTTCSMGSTPAVSQDEPLISRFATFGRNDARRPNRTSVGVAI